MPLRPHAEIKVTMAARAPRSEPRRGLDGADKQDWHSNKQTGSIPSLARRCDAPHELTIALTGLIPLG